MEMEEPNKKKIIKYHSFDNNSQKKLEEFEQLKPDIEIEENKSNISILKKSKKVNNKKVLFNFSKFKIKEPQNNKNPDLSNKNDSLLNINITKNQNDLLDNLKRSAENNNIISTNEITNNYVISTDNKTLLKNKSQENIYSHLFPKNNNIINPLDNKDTLEENFFDLNFINEINNAIYPNQDTKSGLANSNILINSTQNINNNQESLENFENTINSNTIPNNFYRKIEPKTAGRNSLPKLHTKKKKKGGLTFLLRSKEEKYTANDIIIHYLKENERDNSKNIPFKNFKKYLQGIDYGKFNYDLKKIYGYSEKFLKRMEVIKKNNIIAYKKDFNIEDYQNTLLKILKERVSEKSYIKLQASYKQFNERNYGLLIPRGRYVSLAEKLKDFLSRDIYEKMKRTDRNYLLYLNKKEDQKRKYEVENKTKNDFYQKLNKTLKLFHKKLKRNNSYY